MAGRSERAMVQRAEKRQGREGNRWVNTIPTGDEIAAWFKGNVLIDEKLTHEPYVGGVTLIPSKEKSRVITGWDAGNNPVFGDVYDLTLTPYIRVETRVKYFHDLMAEKEWLGVVEPVAPEQQDPRLPKGFFFLSTRTGANSEVRFIACCMKVTVYEKGSVEHKRVTVDRRTGREEFVRVGKVVLDATPATKAVPVLSHGYGGSVEADNFAIMKAETGAVGRALGMAGMLVIPGTGIATAEDLQEANSLGSAGSPESDADLPDEEAGPLAAGLGSAELDEDESLREKAADLIEQMGEFPQAQKAFKAWAKQRGYARLSEVTSPALRGLLRKAENTLKEAQEASVNDSGADPLAG